MNRLEKILSRPTAKPYRSGTVNPDEQLYFNDKGELDFAPDDIENPKNWSTGRRWYITVVCLALCINSTFASSSPSGCLESISEEFHVSVEASGLVITLFLLGYCAGPLFFAPLSEFYGRRYVFYVSFTCYFAFNFLCAFTPSFAGLLVGRFLTGTCASSALTNAPGILADVWGPIERANAMALFSMMTFIGPAVGPVISGFLQLKENWRWSFYVLIWLSGASLLFLVTIPETYPPVVLYNKARRLRATGLSHLQEVKAPVEATGRNLSSIFKVALLRPWLILFDPISTLVAIYLSVVYTLLVYALLYCAYHLPREERLELRCWRASTTGYSHWRLHRWCGCLLPIVSRQEEDVEGHTTKTRRSASSRHDWRLCVCCDNVLVCVDRRI